jgi:hypothetical protein
MFYPPTLQPLNHRSTGAPPLPSLCLFWRKREKQEEEEEREKREKKERKV